MERVLSGHPQDVRSTFPTIAERVSKKLARKYPRFDDEIESLSRYHWVMCREHLPEKKRDDVACMYNCIKYAILRWLHREIRNEHRQYIHTHTPKINTGAFDTIIDTLLDCCEDVYDKAIIRYRVEGYTDQEIGDMLGMSQSTVLMRRRRIQRKYNET
jgi:hypothetical protein